jgi:RimJ/RimL family protein N-acetyltransferase
MNFLAIPMIGDDIMPQRLEVRPYEEKDRQAINLYELPAEQAIYTSIPTLVVETFRTDKFNQPFVICSEDQVVGCFVLYTDCSGNIYTDNKNAILLKSLSIDSRHQKKGYSFHALRILPRLVKQLYKDKDEIILTVHKTNTPAINLYRKAGFVYKGEDYNGEYGIEMIFHWKL